MTLNYWTESESWPNILTLTHAHTLITIPSLFRLIYQVSEEFNTFLKKSKILL